MTDFWFNNYKILFENLDDFYPSDNKNLVEKLNSLMRLSIYLGVILSLFTMNYLYLYIPIFIGFITVLIYNTKKDDIENFLSNCNDMKCDTSVKCVQPTTDNPFMNFNTITDDRYRAPACKSFDNSTIKEKIEDKFNINLYRDVGDLYGKNNSQREFYTMPSTEVVSNQTSFAKWLYNTGPTCKEDTIKCTAEWSPIETDQIFESFVQ